jgi:hypothetical protein
MTEREKRLPRWAQTELLNLRRQNDRLRATIEGETPPDANTFVNDYGDVAGLGPRVGLKRGEKVSFYTTQDTDDWSTRIDVRVEDGWLYVNGGRSLVILPGSSNTIRLRSE